MIEIKKEKSKKKKIKPYYMLKYHYMIGDADGYTSKKVHVSLENPFVERYVTLLNSLKPIILEEDRIFDCLKEGQITEDDYNFLLKMMFEESDSTFEVSEENGNYADEFFKGVSSDTEFSFLVFEGVDLFYIDEYGIKHKTKIK